MNRALFKEKIMVLWPKQIWQQIFVVLILLAMIPIMVLGTVLIGTSEKAMQASVLHDRMALALRAASEAELFVQKPRELLLTVASIIGVSHIGPWQQETALVELSLRYPMFRRVASVSMKGEEIAVSRLGDPKQNWLKDPVFLKARAGENAMSSVRISSSHTPVATLAVPVTALGKINGVLIAEVNLRGIWDIVDSIRVGSSGYACVIGSSGTMIAHPDKKLVLGNLPFVDQAVADSVLAGKNGSLDDVAWHGQKLIVAYAPVRPVGWGLILVQPVSEAYASSRVMQFQSWFVVFLSILAAFFLSIALTRFMSLPLRMLLEGVWRISEKDFDHPLPVGRRDEIGQIFDSFNGIMERLKKAEQSAKLAVIGTAAASIAHELKNSLVLVNTYIQLLGERYQDKQFIREFSRVVPQQLSAWKGMLQNMIDYARPSPYAVDKMDVNELVNDAAALARIRAQEQSVKLVVETAPDLPPVLGNRGKISQVLLNLLSNAFDSTPPQGTIRITTIWQKDIGGEKCRYLSIHVDNTGELIPPQRLDRIFEPFFTTKDGGMGLGLAICREIVEKHRGRIEAFSSPEIGTSFRVHLPLTEREIGNVA